MLVAIALHYVEGGDIPAPAAAESVLLSTSTACHLVCGGRRGMGRVPLPGPLGSVGSKRQLVEMLCSILNI